DGTLSLEAVTAGDFEGRFKPASRFVERLGLSDHPWWIRIAVQNELGDQRRFALMQGPRHYFDSEFFLPGDDGYRPAGPGERFVHRTPVYLVDLPPGEPQVFYWRVNPRGSLIYSINLSTLPAALGNDPLFALYWLLFGVMLALAVYNGLVALMRGGISHGYHAGFLLALAGLVLFSSGILAGHSLIGAWLPQLKMGSLLLAIIGACGIGRTFVDSRHNAPLLDRLLRGVTLLALLFLVAVPWLPITGALAAAFGLGLAAAALLVALGYQAWHREVPLGALYFFTSLLVGSPVVLGCLTMLGLVQSNVDLGLCVMITVNLAGFIQAAGLRIQHHQHLHVKMEHRRSQSVADTVDTTRRETLARMG
ncbi:MAG TPA: hybrid sensor histidine kinase/response regulator, partial [Alcanivorax sp.]|nr:hybrid sensor histidine kinase/response regulator [Alcanivorax sp.]